MVIKTGAGWLANSATLPTALRAVLGYYADAGVFDYGSLSLKREIDERTERMVADVFGLVEDALAAEFDRSSVSFDYDTKLILPAQLTPGYVYRSARQQAAGDPVTDGSPPASLKSTRRRSKTAPRRRSRHARWSSAPNR